MDLGLSQGSSLKPRLKVPTGTLDPFDIEKALLYLYGVAAHKVHQNNILATDLIRNLPLPQLPRHEGYLRLVDLGEGILLCEEVIEDALSIFREQWQPDWQPSLFQRRQLNLEFYQHQLARIRSTVVSDILPSQRGIDFQVWLLETVAERLKVIELDICWSG